MRFVFTLLLLLACSTSIQARSAPDTLTYDGLVVIPAFIIKAGSLDSEGEVGFSMQPMGLRETYLLPYDDQKKVRFLPAVSQGVYSWTGRNFSLFGSVYAIFLRGNQPDSLLRRYPTLETRLPQRVTPHASPDIHFAGVAQALRLPISSYWRKRLYDPHFWILRVTFRYIAAGRTVVTVPNLVYRPQPKVPFTQRWASMTAPVFLITEVLKIAPPYPEK